MHEHCLAHASSLEPVQSGLIFAMTSEVFGPEQLLLDVFMKKWMAFPDQPVQWILTPTDAPNRHCSGLLRTLLFFSSTNICIHRQGFSFSKPSSFGYVCCGTTYAKIGLIMEY